MRGQPDGDRPDEQPGEPAEPAAAQDRPWLGTRAERVDRIVRETVEIGEYPWPGDIAWFHRVPGVRAPEA